jgi:hypothetical protein
MYLGTLFVMFFKAQIPLGFFLKKKKTLKVFDLTHREQNINQTMQI